jgi:non-ribosomal peptide synthase protein (TIGR01720 family)
MPVNANGKLDRAALPEPGRKRESKAYRAPRNRVEEKLCAVWQQTLQLDKVGINDNFFEIGGDSILSIQIVSRSRAAGILITPKQMFQNQTIAQLAAVAGVVADENSASEAAIVTSAGLAPIQHWFFEADATNRNHFNQSVLLELPGVLKVNRAEAAAAQIVAHHDALRLRFSKSEGGWIQTVPESLEPTPFSRFDLSALDARVADRAKTPIFEGIQRSLDIEGGPVVRFAWVDLPRRNPLLLIAAHHLVIDVVSWRILLEDLATLVGTENAELPAKTASWCAWVHRLASLAAAPEIREESTYWVSLSKRSRQPLPLDWPGGWNGEASARQIEVGLSEEETRSLLAEVPEAYQTQINDVLLTALAQAVAKWSARRSVLVDVESHGRHAGGSAMDLSRTVGWFTSIYPVRLDLGGQTGIAAELKAVKETLRSTPGDGLGYGLLRYLSPDPELRRQMSDIPGAEISFNYLGRFEDGDHGNAAVRLSTERAGAEIAPTRLRSHLLDVTGRVENGTLRMIFIYSANLHRRATIENLAGQFMRSLREIIGHCVRTESAGHTPSDFRKVNLNQDELDELIGQIAAAN